ncbi:MAG: hypothetical protein GQ522_03235 [Deltaproteobacteria bacterium]|nr:hypothetical protein [Deltaproteobacteria bacterium]
MAGGHHEVEGPITEKVIVLDLLKAFPDAEGIIQKHLGQRCFSIPGSKTESIEFLAAMHHYHVHLLLADLNKICTHAPSKVGHF